MFKKTRLSCAVTITTGDYIEPAPWTPEDHDRFKKAMDKVRHLRNSEIKKEIQKSISAGAGVIYVNEKVEK
jgi:hypothetical protein